MAGGGLARKTGHRTGAGRAEDYLARVREIAPALAAAGPEIDSRRELPETIVAALVERGLFRLLLPKSLDGAELLPARVCAGHRGAGQDRRQHRLVPQPELRLLDDRGASRARNRARDLRRAARHPGLGAGAGRGAPGCRRLPGHRPLGLRQRQPPCDLARLPCAGHRGRRQAAVARGRHAGRAHHAVPEKRHQVHRHLAHDRAARHRQRRVLDQGSVRTGGLFDRRVVAARHADRRRPACSTGSAAWPCTRRGLPGWRSASRAACSTISSSWRATRSRAAPG